MKYRLTKISTPSNASYPSASSIKEYRANLTRSEGFSPPIEYYVEGEPLNTPAKGESFRMFRDNRNGVKIFGHFVSSPIVDVNEGKDFTLFTTQNSIYKLEKIG